MYKLLTIEWKIKSEMAILLIDVYGGHIWDVYRALIRLEDMKEGFKFLTTDLTMNIQDCVDSIAEKKNTDFQPIVYIEYQKRLRAQFIKEIFVEME